MSLSEIIAELPRLSDEERWELIDRAMALDGFTKDQIELIDERIAEHHRDPASSIPLKQFVAELREEFP